MSANRSAGAEGAGQLETGFRRRVSFDYMGLSFHDLIISKELDDGVREPRRLKSLCLGYFVFTFLHYNYKKNLIWHLRT